ncbi:DNA-binding transcriptional repressor PuuR [Falsiruegeria litorea R37]|uniref:DNA-binding transcriptional repressor PuuR n=1 Tax=Falsiruegeria litorea R37 TaxID=1200284 RepID=A0A1Y5RX21_9RHOB|nr:cupin domain-containing protein [Falsiruegeria litorea]SLN27599.1 DNA-binding transcriptional repressor PuuR [Falsiruegeria litorea R37]
MTPAKTSFADAETLDFPGAITLRILLTGDQTGGTMEVFEDIVHPGVGPGRHIHHQQDETFFFLEGEFDVEIDGQLHRMSPGDVAFVPRGTVHAFKNVGDTPGRLRYIFSPALQVEAMFRAFHTALQAEALTPDEMARIAEAHCQEFVGPPL